MSTVTHMRPRTAQDTQLPQALSHLAGAARAGNPRARRALELVTAGAQRRISPEALLAGIAALRP